ncbi:hypothetical protein [Amycolatopsis sp. cmx-11-32]|uniref:hypothetical protein n=1 Tax=Amycolatopsis sp. cmx-11-32 TaxID=2785796 RepID=UPI0039E678F4
MTTRGWRIERPQKIRDVNGRPALITVGVVRDHSDHFRVALAVSNGPTLILKPEQRDVLAANLDAARDGAERLGRNAR